MNLREARIVLRPRGRLESLDLAFKYVLGDARRAFGWLALVSLVPAFGLTVAARAALGWSWWAVWPLALALGTFTSGIFTVAAGRLLFERHVEPRVVLAAFAQRLPSFLGAVLVARLLLLLGSLAIFGAVLAGMRFAYVSEAVLLEQVPARRALSRSAFLSRAGADDTFGLLLATLGLTLLMVVGIEMLLVSIVEEVFAIPWWRGGSLLQEGGSYYALAAYFATIPWAATSRFLAYIDGRTRQDGWDVQVRLMALEGQDA